MVTLLRPAQNYDHDDIRHLYLCSFPESERKLVECLAIDFLSDDTNPKIISLVAETDGAVNAHIAFSSVTENLPQNWLGYIVAPLAVKPTIKISESALVL